MPVPLKSAIQTFLCGGSRLPFGSGIFQSRRSLRLPLSLRLALVAMVTGTVGSPLDCKFRGMSFCVHGQVCPGVLRSQAWSELCWRFRCSRFHFLVGFSSLSYVCCDVVVSLVLAQFGRTLVWTGQGYIFATLQYMRWAPSWIKLKPEDLQKQVGKLAEEYGALVVDVTLRDGFNVPQVKLVTGIKFLRILKKEGFAPSIPEVLYFFVKKAKSIQKHLDKNRNDRDSKFRLILVENCIHRFARVKFLPASWKYILLRPRLVLVADPHKNAIQTFLCGGSNLPFGREGVVPFRESLECGIRSLRRYFTSVSCTSTSQGDFEHSLSGIQGNSLS